MCSQLTLISLIPATFPNHHHFVYTVSAVTKQYRLPPQVAYSGRETHIHLGSHFESYVLNDPLCVTASLFRSVSMDREHGNELKYLIAMYDDDVEPPKRISTIPEWVEWDSQTPALHIDAPSNMTHKSPVYEFRVMAMVDDNAKPEEIAEEKVVVVVAHSCFNRCPSHWGIGCEDWDLYLASVTVYGVFMLITGCCIHCAMARAYRWVINRDRRRRIDEARIRRRADFKKLKEMNKDLDEEMYYECDDSDDEAEHRADGKPIVFDITENIRHFLWVFWLNFGCCRVDRIQ